jgi:hypothetical protein
MNRVVLVEWDDAWSCHGWTDDTAPKPVRVKTLGFAVQETKQGIVVAQSVGPDGFGSTCFIPNGMIQNVTYLREGGPA